MLAEKVKDKQRELELSDGKMAAKIGMPRSSYNAIFKARRYRVSLDVLRRVIAAFPDLAPYALLEPDPPEQPYRERWEEEPKA